MGVYGNLDLKEHAVGLLTIYMMLDPFVNYLGLIGLSVILTLKKFISAYIDIAHLIATPPGAEMYSSIIWN